MKTFEDIYEKNQNITKKTHLREMTILGKLRDLNIGQRNPAYSNKDVIEGNPYLPEEFINFKNLIPDSDWWWLSSDSDLHTDLAVHNTKGSTSGEGSFQFRFMLNKYFLFICSYDHYIGFTKIKIGFDDIDIEVSNPKSISVSDMENFLTSKSEDVLNFFLGKCKLDNVKREQIVHLFEN